MNALWIFGLVTFWLIVVLVASAAFGLMVALMMRSRDRQVPTHHPPELPSPGGDYLVRRYAWCVRCTRRAQEPIGDLCTICRGERTNAFEDAVRADLAQLDEDTE